MSGFSYYILTAQKVRKKCKRRCRNLNLADAGMLAQGFKRLMLFKVDLEAMLHITGVRLK